MSTPLLGRLSVLRNKLELKPAESDFNRVVVEAIESLNWTREVELVRELHPVPRIFADAERLQEVVTNLLLNARDAVENGGQIRVRTLSEILKPFSRCRTMVAE